MAGDSRHLHDPEKAAEFARALGLMVGGHHPFVGDWRVKGLYAYRSGKYKGQAYFGTGGSESDRLKDTYDPIKPGESNQKYRPWNRDDPKIPEDIRQKLIRLEDRNSTRMNQTSQPSIKPSSDGMLQGEISLKGVHGKYLSAQPDGRAEWNGDHASDWEHFHLEKRQGGKIALKGAHGMYVSAQTNGTVQINRREAPPGGWEEFTVEYRSNDVVCLKSCHGKYLSAQQDGTAQWNRDHAPIGGWEEIQIEQYRKTSEPTESTPFQTGWYRMENADGSLIERVRVWQDERYTSATTEFIATGDLTGHVKWYVEGNTVKVPDFGSIGTIQADGNITWSVHNTKAIYEDQEKINEELLIQEFQDQLMEKK